MRDAMGFSLTGTMIPRHVRRMFEQRAEPRVAADNSRAMLCWRGRSSPVRIGNVSNAGVMLWFDEVPHIGERVAVQLLDQEAMPGQVRWVRDGRVGINFTEPLS
ncbi:MAG: PilZ domain-containing protein [Sphingomicrobium sp.]